MLTRNPLLTRRLAGYGTTIFTEMTRLANKHGAINLAQGFPDWDGPDLAREAAREAVSGGFDQYGRMTGVPVLNQRIAERWKQRTGLDCDPDTEVVVGCGATELIFASVQALCDVGDEVILFEPFYDSYRASVHLAGAIPRVVTLRYPEFTFDPLDLDRAFSPRTKLLILNNPHNPGGRVLTREELVEVASLCQHHGVICLADEVYEHLVYEGEHLSIATLPGMRERTITLSSLSKTFSLTGWRIGWAVAAPPLASAVRLVHQFATFSAPTPLQVAAARVLAADASYYEELISLYRQKRDWLVETLRQAGFSVRPPQGTYFICAGIEPLGYQDDVAFCRWLTETIRVAAIPPSAFYERAEEGRRYVRFAFCKQQATLEAAAQRLVGVHPRKP
ncbi:MAG: methionine aminotransferase [Myxococcales bacterium]|nr:methionine aminotransferase [Polyangiaceae bacterium]MDW8251171.1 methionine aminotransferase [Myxococcales bacterium]